MTVGAAELPAEMNEAANPRSMEAALLDLALLSTCDDMVVTVASSFGWVAGKADIGSLHIGAVGLL